MSLRAEIELTNGTFELAVEFEVPHGGVLAVLGPNGSGKSTILRTLSGLLAPHRSKIELDGRELTGVPAHDRRIGLLAQDPLLFPHLSALDNVAFSPRSQGAGKRAAAETARHWLSEVDASELASRRPAQLSGGQAQRVAVARALAGQPDLLLLDEPLAALDVDAAPAIRGLLRRVLADRSRVAVLVTHDPLDALALAEDVVVLDAGRIVERGPVKQVLSAPRTAFTARIAGLNLVSGTAEEGGLRTDEGHLLAGIPSTGSTGLSRGTRAVAVFPPSAVAVYRGDQVHGSPRNTVPAVVSALEPHGPVIRVRAGAVPGAPAWAAGLSADLTPAAVADLALEPGTTVTLSVKATTVTVHEGQ